MKKCKYWIPDGTSNTIWLNGTYEQWVARKEISFTKEEELNPFVTLEVQEIWFERDGILVIGMERLKENKMFKQHSIWFKPQYD